jgi:hypothetical protein
MLRRRLLRQQLLGRSLPSFSPRIANQSPPPPTTAAVCVVGLERDLQHGLKFTALLAEQECKIVLRLGAQSAATQCFASHCAYRIDLAAWLHTAALYYTN